MGQTVEGNHALYNLVTRRCHGRVFLILGLATPDRNSLHTVRPYKERMEGPVDVLEVGWLRLVARCALCASGLWWGDRSKAKCHPLYSSAIVVERDS